MACLNVEAEVVALVLQAISGPSGAGSKRASVPEPPRPQDASATLHALFVNAYVPDVEHGEHDERPQKRRKIGAHYGNYDHPVYLPEARSVSLAKVTINLVGPHFRVLLSQ